jgi:hypothetical protein
MPDVELEPTGDDAQLRERMGQLAAAAGRTSHGLPAAPEIRRRGARRHRRRVAGSAAAVGLGVVVLAGVVLPGGILRSAPEMPASPPTLIIPTLVTPSPTTGPTTGPTSTPTGQVTGPSPGTTTSPRVSPGGSGSTTPDPSRSPSGSPVPPPTGEVRAPWDRAGSDFGFVTGVQRSAGGGVTITFDRAQWLTGAEYEEYVARNGTPENDYVILNESRQVRRIELDASVLLQGSSLAGQDGSDSAPMTLDEFVTAAGAAAARGPVPVWLFHATSDLSSPVTGLQEQYLP